MLLLDGFLVGALSLKMLQSSKEKWKQMLTDIKSKVAAKHLQSESILSYKHNIHENLKKCIFNIFEEVVFFTFLAFSTISTS